MATGPGTLGKIRNPWAILGLTIITLGIYFVYWWGKINAEIRRHDPNVGGDPTMSVLAVVSAYFIFPIFAWVSIYKTAARIRQMQDDEGNTDTIIPILALVLGILLGIGLPLYIGYQLRDHWRGHGA